MRARLIALVATITTMAMILPAIGSGLGRVCDAGMLTAGDCCCDDGDSVEASTTPAKVAAACCCELREAPADVGTSAAMALSSGTDHAPEFVGATTFHSIGRTFRRGQVARVQSRGPPPLRTLLAQRTAMIC